jgi:hypothetical protein
MACFETGTLIELSPREAVTLQDVRGATLRITRGTIWLTQQDDRKDVILRVGDNWVVEKDGATVLEAQNDDTIVYVVGRQVEDAGARERLRPPPVEDWRDRLDRLLMLSPASRATPYY